MGNRLKTVCLIFFGALVGCACTPEPSHETNPNIILILGDDHGYPYFGFMGDEHVRTPHLDQLASRSTLFPRAYTSASQCRDSLLTLLTGLHPEQWRAKNRMLERQSGKRRVPFQEIVDFETLPRILSREGYATFQGGKYWEGTYKQGGFTHGLKFRVDQEAIDEFGHLRTLAGADGLNFGRETLRPLWEFIEEFEGKKPFYIWFAPMLPHTPHNAPKRFLDLYEDEKFSRSAARYYANISWFDEVLGQLMAYLDANGLRENTLVIYISDNGWEQAPDQSVSREGGDHGKNSIYDFGFRTPLMFSWPGVIDQGVVYDELVAEVDLFPTTLDFLGIDVPKNRMGISLYPKLMKTGDFSRREVIGGVTALRRDASKVAIERKGWDKQQDAYFLRDESWRFIWRKTSAQVELFEIEIDPLERNDLSDQYPERVAGYKKRIDRWIGQCREGFSSPVRSSPIRREYAPTGI